MQLTTKRNGKVTVTHKNQTLVRQIYSDVPIWVENSKATYANFYLPEFDNKEQVLESLKNLEKHTLDNETVKVETLDE